MKTIYVIPPVVESKPQIDAMLQRAGVSVVAVEHLYDLWPFLNDEGRVVAQITDSDLNILFKYASTMLPVLPKALTGFPGAAYLAQWNVIAGPLQQIRFEDFEVELLKAGHVANTTAQLEKSAPVSLKSLDEPSTQRRMKRPASEATGGSTEADNEFEGSLDETI